MKKIYKICMSAALMLSMSAGGSVFAAAPSLGSNSDILTSTIEIGGSTETYGFNREAVLIVTDKKTFSEENKDAEIKAYIEAIDEHGDDVLYAGKAVIDYSGNYSINFGFDTSGEKTAFVICDGKTEVFDFIWHTKSEVAGFYSDISKGDYSESTLFDKLAYYSSAAGVKLMSFESDTEKDLLVKRVLGRKSEFSVASADEDVIIANGNTKFKEITDKAVKEYTALLNIKNAENTAEIEGYITDIKNLAIPGVTFNYNGKNEFTINQSLKGQLYPNAEALSLRISELCAGGNVVGGSTTYVGGVHSGSSGVTYVPSMNTTSSQDSFSDLNSVEWAKEAVEALYKKGVINGTGEKQFSPNQNVTREQLVKMIVLGFGISTDGVSSDFADADKNEWYYPYISAAYANGIIKGSDDGKFGIGENISRQDMAVMLYRASKNAGKGYSVKKNDFSDWNTVAEYATEAVECLAGEGIINGVGNGEFSPKACATRAQAAKIIYALIK